MSEPQSKKSKTDSKLALPFLDPQDMIKAGLHFGHEKATQHPKIRPFIFSIRNNIAIFDVEKTAERFEKTLEYIRELIREGGIILFVSPEVPASTLIENMAGEAGMPYVKERWLGGILSNFKAIRERIDHLIGLEGKKKSGELEKYTKWEQHEFDVELARLSRKFGSFKTLTKLPDALFLTNLHSSRKVAEEARLVGVSVIAICDSNADPSLADHIIPANDDSVPALTFILGKVAETIRAVRSGS